MRIRFPSFMLFFHKHGTDRRVIHVKSVWFRRLWFWTDTANRSASGSWVPDAFCADCNSLLCIHAGCFADGFDSAGSHGWECPAWWSRWFVQRCRSAMGYAAPSAPIGCSCLTESFAEKTLWNCCRCRAVNSLAVYQTVWRFWSAVRSTRRWG